MRVNEAAGSLGISESWLRRAEQRGHIPKARRDINGWRFYSQAEVSVLRELLFPTGAGASGNCLTSTNTPKGTNL